LMPNSKLRKYSLLLFDKKISTEKLF